MPGDTRVYVGNLNVTAKEHDLDDAFSKYGRLRDVWVARKPPGFAFLEFEDERDARDAVDEMNGKKLLGQYLRVEISARGRNGAPAPRGPPVRTKWRINVSGLSKQCTWQDLKSFFRKYAEPGYVDVMRNGDGVAEFLTRDDMEVCARKLDDSEFMGRRVTLNTDFDRERSDSRSHSRRGSTKRHSSKRKARSRSQSRNRKTRSRSKSRKEKKRRSRSRSHSRKLKKSRSSSRGKGRHRDRSKSRSHKRRKAQSKSSSRGRSTSNSNSPEKRAVNEKSDADSGSELERRSDSEDKDNGHGSDDEDT